MNRIYAGIQVNTFLIPIIYIHMMSRLTPETLGTLQACLDVLHERRDPRFPKDFPWKTASVEIFYHGLEHKPNQFQVDLPDGRIAKVRNLNPGQNEYFPRSLREYADTMEVGRQALLHGSSAETAVQKMWTCFQNTTSLKHTNITQDFMLNDIRNLQDVLIEEGYLPDTPNPNSNSRQNA